MNLKVIYGSVRGNQLCRKGDFMDELTVEIEQTRRALLKIAKERGFSSSETIRLSKELDNLLNAYTSEQQHIRHGIPSKKVIS